MSLASSSIESARRLQLQGRRGPAQDLLLRHLGTQPSDLEAWELLAVLCLELGQLPEAKEAASRGIQLSPEDPRCWIHLALCLWQERDLQLAHQAFQQASRLTRRNPQLHYLQGSFYLELGSLRLAELNFTAALSLEDSPRNRAAMATLREHQARWEESYELLAPLMRGGFREPTACVTWQKVCSQLGRAGEARPALAEALGAEPPLQARRALRYSLAQVDESAGDYEQAFRSWREANQLAGWSWDPAAWHAEIEARIQFFTAERLAALPRRRPQSGDPVLLLIVGMPRSGTSLLEQMLAQHPQVLALGERSTLSEASHALTGSTGLGEFSALQRLAPETLQTTAEPYLMALQGASPPRTHLTDKMPSNFLQLPLALQLFREVRVLHCVRHPLDTLLSAYRQNFNHHHSYTTRLDWLGEYYRGYRRLMAHWEQLPGLSIHRHSYEELLADPEERLRAVLKFCGLSWEPSCLDFHLSSRHVPTASYAQVQQPLQRASQERWRHYLPWLGELKATLEAEGLLVRDARSG